MLPQHLTGLCNLYMGQLEFSYDFGSNSLGLSVYPHLPAVPLYCSFPYLSLCLHSRFIINAKQTTSTANCPLHWPP